MCGGCGGGGARDWASAAVATPAARAVAAATATALCRAVGEPSRVVTSPGGWLVSSATGAAAAPSTLTSLWEAVPALARRMPAGGVPDLDGLGGAGGAAAGRGEGRDGGGGGAGRAPGRRVAVLVGDASAPEASWADAVLDGDDPARVVGGVDAAAPGSRILVRCASDAAATGALAALTAPGPAQRSTVTALVCRARPHHPWADDLAHLDASGGASALAVLEGAAPPAGRGAAGTVHRLPAVHPAAAACWGAAALAAGGLAGRRVRLVVDDDRVVVDLLGRTAVALRWSP